MLKSLELRRALVGVSQEFAKIPVDDVAVSHRSIWEGSDEGNLRPMDGSGVAAASAEGTTAAAGAKGTTALDRFSQDLTAKAKSGDDGPDSRPRRRDPPDRRRADAPAPEQPDPHRRSGRRQDRGRRGLRAAHRRGRRAAAAARGQALRARRRPDAGGRLDEGRVRAAPAFGHRRSAVLSDPDHPVHRRGAHADRRRRRGGDGRRGQSAQARARARHAAHDRRDHLGRVPAIFREGSGADPALPVDPRSASPMSRPPQ